MPPDMFAKMMQKLQILGVCMKQINGGNENKSNAGLPLIHDPHPVGSIMPGSGERQ
jgi:hypothetical protein